MLGNPDVVEKWDEEAEELGMSRSEYIRSMVNAGRRQISQLDPQNDQDNRSLREEVLSEIPEDEVRDVDEIVQTVVGPIEEKITSQILPNLDENGEIRFNPQKGGYEKQ